MHTPQNFFFNFKCCERLFESTMEGSFSDVKLVKKGFFILVVLHACSASVWGEL